MNELGIENLLQLDGFEPPTSVRENWRSIRTELQLQQRIC